MTWRRLKVIDEALSEEEAVSRSLSMANANQLQQRNCVVIKVDAAFKEGWSCLAGVAGPDEEPWATWYQRRESISPLQAEANALLLSLKMALSFNWRRVTILSDCLVLVSSILATDSDPWEIRSQLSSIRCLIKSFELCSIKWISRGNNSAAHRIGQMFFDTQESELHVFASTVNPFVDSSVTSTSH